MGIFHPVLAMPESVADEGNGERVRHILMHEFIHVRRGDLFIIVFLNLLCSIYWFNPITWFCFSCIRRDEYREFAVRISQNDGSGDFSDMSDPWGMIAPDIMMSSRNFGYAVRDMDSNGVPELFLLTNDGSVWAMYTFIDGEIKLLDTFWPRNLCVLDLSDLIYINWSNGAFDNGRDAYRISKDGRELELILRVAMESTDEAGNPLDEPRYYKCVSSESDKSIISAEEADAETSEFPQNNDNSGLEFIPLG
jgi:hypothetical protein